MNKSTTNTHFFGNDDRPVFRIIIYCLSLAFSVLVASLETVRHDAAGLSFELSWRTLVVFALGALFFVPCFKVIFQSSNRKSRAIALAAVCAVGVAAFLYPLRYVPMEKHGEIFVGLAIATVLLSGIGIALLSINRFLNRDAEAVEAPSKG
jgi:hypothetical protein